MKTQLLLIVLILLLIPRFLQAQDELSYLGLTVMEAKYKVGMPTSEYEEGYGLYALYYSDYNNYNMTLHYAVTNNRCRKVTLEFPITTEENCQSMRDNLVSILQVYGFKKWKTTTAPDAYILFTPRYFARLEILYMGGNHVGFDDFGFRVIYFPNEIK